MRTFKISTIVFIVTAFTSVGVECLCRYRDLKDLPRTIFKYWASWGCYDFTRPDQFINEPLQASICNVTYEEKEYRVKGLTINDKCIPFSYLDKQITEAVRKTFRHQEIYEKWNECCQDALVCCDDVMRKNKLEEGHCSSVWDGWACFHQIPGGETYEQLCPKYAYARESPRCFHYSRKYCDPDGTWTVQTDYSSCDPTPKLIARTQWHISMLMISIAVCTPAIIILICDKSLHTKKLCMIQNFLTAIVIRNFILILVKSILIMDEITNVNETIMDKNQWGCKVLTFFEKLSGNVVFTMMLLEGIYLHQLLTNVFRSRKSNGPKMLPFYIMGGLISVCSAVVWAVIMSIFSDEYCWQNTEKTHSHWIYNIPRLLMLITNLALLIHIIIALWSTLKNKENENHPSVRTAKAALICLPLFGIPFFFLLIYPDTNSCQLEQFYYFVYYTIEALQGILIAILHCYRERDVKNKIRLVFEKSKSYITENPYWKRRSSSLTDSDTRRTTLSSATESPDDVPRLSIKRPSILKVHLPANDILGDIPENCNCPLAGHESDQGDVNSKDNLFKKKSSEYPDSPDDLDKFKEFPKVKQVQFQ